MMAVEDKGPVCVTGGTGYMASWLVMRLLQDGYSVHATIRSGTTASKCERDISYITSLPKASTKLKIYTADLNEPESFHVAIEGCVAVFHVAHPIGDASEEPEETVTRRAVDGILGVLKGCLKSKTVKRVVYTSSLATVAFNNGNGDQNELNENMWSDVEICRKIDNVSRSYLVSKIMTEKTALEFSEQHGLDFVSLVLPLVVGPFICPQIPSSVYIFLTMLLGKRDEYKYLFYSYNMVHVDDVANALIFFLEHPTSKGRYICSSAEMSMDEMFKYLSEKYPEYELPTAERLQEIRAHGRPKVSSKKLLDCGFKFKYGIDNMFEGAVKCCKDKGLL